MISRQAGITSPHLYEPNVLDPSLSLLPYTLQNWLSVLL